MEIIEIPGYTHEEKTHIAKIHLLAKGLESHGLTDKLFALSDDAAAEAAAAPASDSEADAMAMAIGTRRQERV